MRSFDLMKLLLLTSAGLLSSSAFAQEGPAAFKPRIETGLKAGTERSIAVTEAWVPVAQDSDSVLYGDVRYMGDDQENREGNIGLGYRTIYENNVVGGHVWYDRRRTERGSTFHQTTLGAEVLGEDLDIRGNVYIPLSDKETYVTPNIGRTTPYLAGSGIFTDTNGEIIEEPQSGMDFEIGYRVPVFEENVDAIRIYGGGYSFSGSETPDVRGWRTRIAADINPWLKLGTSFQRDEERGSQAFLEATLRFPFSAKKSFRKEGLRSRLDESPERDIDIVSGSAKDNGLMKPVVNVESGQQQRVIYVDNAAVSGGNGSLDNPYNTLASAQSVLLDYDILYVKQGTGTTTGMNQGFVIDKSNVTFIGSGTDFVYDANKFRAARGSSINASTLIAATAAPVITNTQTDGNAGTVTDGNGLYVTGANTTISGINVSNAAAAGIRVQATGAAGDVNISDVTVTGANEYGVIVEAASSSAHIDNVNLDNITTTGNSIAGVYAGTYVLASANNAKITNITADHITANGQIQGLGFGAGTAAATARIENITASNVTTNHNGLIGTLIQTASSGGSIGAITADHVTANNNNSDGFYIHTSVGGSRIDSIDLSNITGNNNGDNNGFLGTARGVRVNVQGSSITNRASSGNTTMSHITASGNRSNGIQVEIYNADVGTVSLTDLTTIGNVDGNGIETSLSSSTAIALNIDGAQTINNLGSGAAVFVTNTGGVLTSSTLKNITANGNGVAATSGYGLYLGANNGGVISSMLVDHVSSTNNFLNGVSIQALAANTAISMAIQNSNFTGNQRSGVNVDDDTLLTFNIDMGGGTLGSIGNNTLTGNRLENVGTYADLYVDLDGGSMFARNNWWGQAGGPVAGQVKNIGAPHNGTADSASPLSTAP